MDDVKRWMYLWMDEGEGGGGEACLFVCVYVCYVFCHGLCSAAFVAKWRSWLLLLHTSQEALEAPRILRESWRRRRNWYYYYYYYYGDNANARNVHSSGHSACGKI